MACFNKWDWGTCDCSPSFIVLCGTARVPGATVTIKDGGGATVASGTTNSQGTVSLPIPAAGTYTVTATAPNDAGYSGSIALTCCGTYQLQVCLSCATTICVTGCPSGAALAGATVTVTGAASGSPCTTTLLNGTACCTVSLPAAGSYPVSITAAGYQPWNGTLSLACGGTTTIGLSPTTQPASVTFTVKGCCGSALPGATVTTSDGQSATTDATGSASFWIAAPGTYTYTVSKTRFADSTGSFAISGCSGGGTQTIAVGMTPASGYACGPKYEQDGTTLRPDPIPTTLHLTDSLYGSTTLTYYANPSTAGLTWLGTSPVWTGTISGASFPGYAPCGCPASTFSIRYTMPGCSTSTLNIVSNGSNYIPGACSTAVNCPSDSGQYVTCPSGPPPGPIWANGTDAVGVGDNSCLCDGGPSIGSYALAAGLPFDLTAHVSAQAQTCTNGLRNPWYGGGTITATE